MRNLSTRVRSDIGGNDDVELTWNITYAKSPPVMVAMRAGAALVEMNNATHDASTMKRIGRKFLKTVESMGRRMITSKVVCETLSGMPFTLSVVAVAFVAAICQLESFTPSMLVRS